MKKLALLFSAALYTATAHASLDESMEELCGKMKTCSLEEIKKQNLGAEMEQMMVGMFDAMCKTWISPYAQTLGQAGLEDKAEACIDSVVSESCESLMAQQGSFNSEECQEFEKAADEAGVDLKNQGG